MKVSNVRIYNRTYNVDGEERVSAKLILIGVTRYRIIPFNDRLKIFMTELEIG